MAQPAFNPAPQNDPHDDTVRLWLSQQQWMSVLESTERQARQTDAPPTDNQRQSPRHPAAQDMRCLVRLGLHADHAGTFLVKLRDISASGLGFYSAQPFTSKSRCTIALQDGQGHGLVAAASIVWCKPAGEQLHDVGIQFDQPINADWVAPNTPDDIPI